MLHTSGGHRCSRRGQAVVVTKLPTNTRVSAIIKRHLSKEHSAALVHAGRGNQRFVALRSGGGGGSRVRGCGLTSSRQRDTKAHSRRTCASQRHTKTNSHTTPLLAQRDDTLFHTMLPAPTAVPMLLTASRWRRVLASTITFRKICITVATVTDLRTTSLNGTEGGGDRRNTSPLIKALLQATTNTSVLMTLDTTRGGGATLSDTMTHITRLNAWVSGGGRARSGRSSSSDKGDTAI